MKQTKTQSGITLVALIITIIVLLILAIVSIRAIQQGGIIGKSQNAVNSYEDKRKLEENRLNEYDTLINSYMPENNKGTGGSEGIIYKEVYKTYGQGTIIFVTENGINKMKLYNEESNYELDLNEPITIDSLEYEFTVKHYTDEQHNANETITFNNNNSQKIITNSLGTIYIKDNILYFQLKEDGTDQLAFQSDRMAYLVSDFDFTILPDYTK